MHGCLNSVNMQIRRNQVLLLLPHRIAAICQTVAEVYYMPF
jgi:hypothetical protein